MSTRQILRGFNQQRRIHLRTVGNLTFDPNKKLTFYYNHLNLPYKITGDQQDEVLMQYGADGTLLQRKYIKNNEEVSKTDYLRGKELNNGLMEHILERVTDPKIPAAHHHSGHGHHSGCSFRKP
ncbi:MAG: hypothetical protein IPN79_15690 [Saprospiraceae bacterium]|nr:hypothetical protein [Saprospiraceae bacterium]